VNDDGSESATDTLTTRARLWRLVRPVLAIAAVAFVFDVLMAFRVSYLGVTDDRSSDAVVELFLGTILLIQARIAAIVIGIAALLWTAVRGGLGLSAGRAYVATALLWLSLLVQHARLWPAAYADALEARPVPGVLFLAVVEGWLGTAFVVAAVLAVAVLLALDLARDRRLSRIFRAVLGCAAAAGLFLVVSATPSTPAWERVPTGGPERPDVLLLMSDSWRADHFECRATSELTPRLGALCQKYGATHLRAYPPQPRTFGSVSALFTGLPPDKSGVLHMMVRREHRDLSGRSLLRRFADLGYRTEAVAGFVGDVFPRVNLGFERIHAPTFGFATIISEFCLRAHPLILPLVSTNAFGRDVIEPAFWAFLDLADPGLEIARAYKVAAEPDPRPLFLTVFLSVTHSPYAVNTRRARRRGGDPLPARYRWHPPAWRNVELAVDLPPAIRNRYADAVQAADEVLGALAEQALARGNTIVVITSDHGELLYEFGEGNHGDHVFGDGHLAVPLVIFDSRAKALPTEPERVVSPSPTGETDTALHALMDTLPAVLRGIEEGRRISVPARNVLYAESGVILSALGPQIIAGYRVDYPELLGLLELDHELGDVVLQERWVRTVELGKFRSLMTPGWTFYYSPGCKEPRLSMVPRLTTAKALPAYSVGDRHPEAVERAWELMQERWGADIVRRDRCGEQR